MNSERFGILNAEQRMAHKSRVKGSEVEAHKPKEYALPGLGARLKAARESAGYETVEAFRKASGISKGMISQAENELNNLSLKNLLTWCRVAKVRAGALLDPDIDERSHYLQVAQKLRGTIGTHEMEWMADLDRIEARIAIEYAHNGVDGHRRKLEAPRAPEPPDAPVRPLKPS